MYIIIAGCRKVGTNLALMLAQENHDIVVIDSDPKNLEALGSGFNGVTILGMPIDEDVLRSAGVERADALAAVTSDDNMNVMISQVAKELFKVPRVITRIYDPERDIVFKKMGLETICSTMLTVERIVDLLIPRDRPQLVCFHKAFVSFRYTRPGKRLIGKRVGELAEEHILGFVKNGVFVLARSDSVIGAGDTLILAESAPEGELT